MCDIFILKAILGEQSFSHRKNEIPTSTHITVYFGIHQSASEHTSRWGHDLRSQIIESWQDCMRSDSLNIVTDSLADSKEVIFLPACSLQVQPNTIYLPPNQSVNSILVFSSTVTLGL